MDRVTKELLKMENKDMGDITTQMEIYMMDAGEMISNLDREKWYIPMEMYMMGCGVKGKKMGKAYINITMEHNILAIL